MAACLNTIGVLHPCDQLVKRSGKYRRPCYVDDVHDPIRSNRRKRRPHAALGPVPRHSPTNLSAGDKCDPSGVTERKCRNHNQTTDPAAAAGRVQTIKVRTAAKCRNPTRQFAGDPEGGGG